MFKFWGSQEQQADADPRPQEVSTNSWYSPSSSSSSRPSTPNSINTLQRPGDQPQPQPHLLSPVSPTEAAAIIVYLQDKSADELRKLLSDKEAYQQFLLSLDLVKTPNNLRDELRNETLQLARENLAKESSMTELRNQCMIIRTTELATAEEKLNELNRQKAEILRSYSPASLLHQLQELINKTDEESEMLHKQLLEKEMDVASFVHKREESNQEKDAFARKDLDDIAEKLVQEDPYEGNQMPFSVIIKLHHNSLTGNYDINMLITVIERKGKKVVGHDRRNRASSINLDEPESKLMGIVLNVPVRKYDGLCAPLGNRPHLLIGNGNPERQVDGKREIEDSLFRIQLLILNKRWSCMPSIKASLSLNYVVGGGS
ncbi:unnamed protein product [Lactuca virosa]|uniref:ubiquitinyl hydrolase 1 n=1 Tax=Lactuca virosa TaxID=75947 RepID=A0AAU9NJE1_9ASTR|nr:unnamed protein product [Lactuca virosa]